MKPRVALVQGDACGIGPELMAKLLALAEVREAAQSLIVGDRHFLEMGCRTAGVDHEINVIESVEQARYESPRLDLVEMHALDPEAVTPGKVSKQAGAAGLAWYGLALDLCERGVRSMR